MDDVTWAALTLTLTVLGAIWTWTAFRRRGVASGLRALAFTLLPLAAYLTNTLRMFTRIVDAVASWATALVFSPVVWAGVILAGVSVALFVVSGSLRARQLGQARPSSGAASRASSTTSAKAATSGSAPGRSLPPAASGKGEPAIDDDLADIEALLRKRGIS